MTRALVAALAEELERAGAIRTPAVRRAFLTVPRELFVPEHAERHGLEAVYRNEVIVTAHDAAGRPISSSSQPQLMAAMLERLAVGEGMRILEIGAGTGYNAALLSELVGPRGRVTTVDVEADVVEAARGVLEDGSYRVETVCADGALGHPPGAPYDRIIVTAGTDAIPAAWCSQLVEGGLLEVPLRFGPDAQAVVTLRRRGETLESVAVLTGRFIPMRTQQGSGAPAVSLLATESRGSEGWTTLAHLTGNGVGRLPLAARRRALALMLDGGRSQQLGIRFPTWWLGLYLFLELPPARLVARHQDLAVGWVEPDGRSLALVAGRSEHGDRPSPQRLLAYGGPEAQAALEAVLETWESRGRPNPDRLYVRTTFRDGRSRIVRRWR
jgi:protein-L-isoaspartate(D-aspartate) O-methyltransferase